MTGRTFEQWVEGIFDHPVREPPWFFNSGVDLCIEPEPQNILYITRLFKHCGEILKPFDNDQVGQGFNLLVSNSCSDHPYSIVTDETPWPIRREAVRAIYDVYSKCFAARCDRSLGHLATAGDSRISPLRFICYMWWDIFPVHLSPEDKTEQEATEYLSVMEKCLSIQHPACIEAALHGLGHWHLNYPDQVERIVDRFIAAAKHIPPELAEYALKARSGGVQ